MVEVVPIHTHRLRFHAVAQVVHEDDQRFVWQERQCLQPTG